MKREHVRRCSGFRVSSLLLSSLDLSDTQVYEPYIRARLGTGAVPVAARVRGARLQAQVLLFSSSLLLSSLELSDAKVYEP